MNEKDIWQFFQILDFAVLELDILFLLLFKVIEVTFSNKIQCFMNTVQQYVVYLLHCVFTSHR